MTSDSTQPPRISWRAALALWTVGIWGGRLRNAIEDVELVGTGRLSAIGVAVIFVLLGVVVGFGAIRRQWHWTPLVALALIGIARWTYRGPIILLSDEFSIGFKVVHTVLWLVTAFISVLALREHRRVRESSTNELQTSMVG